MAQTDFEAMLAGYGLATARILYRIPDHRSLLQTFVWQEYDLAPRFPALMKFLDYWQRELDGPVHSVEVAHSRLVRPAELRHVDGAFRLQ